MGDMLSQDEINALLGGLGNSDSAPEKNSLDDKDGQNNENSGQNVEAKEANPEQNQEQSPDKKQGDTEQIDGNGGLKGEDDSQNLNTANQSNFGASENLDNMLTNEQKDILGEIGNISMGTSATTLFALLNNKVTIDTPNVSVMTWKQLEQSYDRPCVGIRVGYKEGLVGSNILILKQSDVKIISNLMMGGDGNIEGESELNEIDLSAIGEAMNQMVGSASTSLSSMIKMKIDIDTPHAFILDFKENQFFEATGFNPEEMLVCISFKMEIGTLIDSEIMQILPKDFAIEMVETIKSDLLTQQGGQKVKSEPTTEQNQTKPPGSQENLSKPQSGQGNRTEKQARRTESTSNVQQNVNVQPAQFQTFELSQVMQQKENIDIIMDVPLEVTVELGRTHKKIRDILEFSPGTIVELNKLAGEPIDILVNGKFIAKGEVVVIDENFGIRITDIISTDNRI